MKNQATEITQFDDDVETKNLKSFFHSRTEIAFCISETSLNVTKSTIRCQAGDCCGFIARIYQIKMKLIYLPRHGNCEMKKLFTTHSLLMNANGATPGL